MKKFDLVKLINKKPYIKNNLQENMHGIVINENIKNVIVLFFNPKNIGDFAIVSVNIQDLIIDKEKLPGKMQQEISANLDKILKNAKNYLELITINEYCWLKKINIQSLEYTKETEDV